MAQQGRRNRMDTAGPGLDAAGPAPPTLAGGGTCPICHRPRGPAPRGPFCSERCRLVDLHRWLNGAYRIGTEPSDQGLREQALEQASETEELA